MTAKLALYKGKGQIGNTAIRLWTGSIYSHCELVVDGWCYSSSVMDKGVRRKRVGPGADEISLSADHWDQIELPWADGASIVRYFEATDRDVYGWPSLIASQVFNRNQPSEHAAFCSEWCARALILPSPSIYSPGTLGAFCHWRNNLAA
ncbi:hypothetical protein [Pseudomonas leptonychotis]|uniref:hypothetical protein n=1 Tax=Pseudomonas leptonychotis TaxID=2448482 RepID=UPI00386AA62A